MRVLFDSNIYISAIVFGGVPQQALFSARRHDEIDIIASSFIIEEVSSSLASKKFGWSSEKIIRTVRLFFDNASLYEPEEIMPITRDPKDDPILACALMANAAYIITGDNDLLSIKKQRSVIILSPKQFLALDLFHT